MRLPVNSGALGSHALPTPGWLPEFVQARIDRDRAASREPAWIDERNGMTLYGTIGHEAVLRTDGSVWFYEAVDWVNSEEYEWRLALGKERWAALVLGTKRFPELLELLPERPADAPNCSRCEGTGFFHEIACWDCGALGWDPEVNGRGDR